MGIQCQIKVYKTAGDVIRPGSLVSGVLKYVIDQETICNKITVSFKGNGYILVKHKKRESNIYTYRKSEDYIDVDYIIYRDEAGAKLTPGTYETEFHFILPENIPPTLRYTKKTKNYLIHCYITYYIRIKFEKCGLVNELTKFKRPVKVVSIAVPKLPNGVTVYGDQKTLRRPFSRNPGVLKIAATVTNSVVVPGEIIKIDYEVNNDTHVNVRAVVVQVIEVYSFKSKRGREITFVENMDNTVRISGIIKSGEIKNRVAEIPLPLNVGSLDHSNLVSREYFLTIALELPMKYEDMVLRIPIQIGDEIKPADGRPPTYWDVLVEDGINQFSDNQFDSLSLTDAEESETEL